MRVSGVHLLTVQTKNGILRNVLEMAVWMSNTANDFLAGVLKIVIDSGVETQDAGWRAWPDYIMNVQVVRSKQGYRLLREEGFLSKVLVKS